MNNNKKGMVLANKGQLNIFGILDYKQNDRVIVEEVGEAYFVQISKEHTKPTRIMRHLINTEIEDDGHTL